MKISKDWLSDYLDLSALSDAELENIITTKVAEVDGIEHVGEIAATAEVAVVKDVKPHPSKESLKQVTVGLGKDEVAVVCGAPNVVQGMLTAYIPVGQNVINTKDGSLFIVEEREVAGVKSNGILVSEAELGFGADHSGLIDLAEFSKLRPGEKLSAVVGAPDLVLEIDNKSLTHRPDLWGHHGFARELAAILNKKLLLDIDAFADVDAKGEKLLKNLGKGQGKFKVSVVKGSGCRRFAGIEIGGFAVERSPFWLRRRLLAVGAGVRNVIVDLSNYVMHDLGQPNHAYDAAKLTGKVISARLAKEGEKFISLDEIERTLTKDDMVIADDSGVVALAGIIGGASTAVSESTTELFLESANFDATLVRHTAKRQGVRTDASNRFEKGRTPYAVPAALHRYLQLLTDIQKSAAATAAVTDDFVERPAQIQIPLSYEYVQSRLVKDLSAKEIDKILSGLGFTPQKGGRDGVKIFDVPYYRAGKDISIEDDLVEELGRIYGYERIPETSPLIKTVPVQKNLLRDLEYQVRDLLSGTGMSEIYDYSFINGELQERYGYSLKEAVQLQNPVDTNEQYLRLSAVPGMCLKLAENSRFADVIALFELGRSYFNAPLSDHENLKLSSTPDSIVTHERRLLCLGYSSGRDEKQLASYLQPELPAGADFYALAGVVRKIISLVSSAELELLPLVSVGSSGMGDAREWRLLREWMHPYRTAVLRTRDMILGVIAEVKPGAVEDLNRRAVVAELDLELLLELSGEQRHFTPPSKYPSSLFEMSVVMPEKTRWTALRDMILQNVERKYVRSIDVISVYTGKPLVDGQKSVSVKISFGADDRTLSGDELGSFQQRLIEVVEGSEFSLRR